MTSTTLHPGAGERREGADTTAPGGTPAPTDAAGAAPRLIFSCNQSRFFVTHRLPLAEAARKAGYEVHIAVPLDSPGTEALRAAGFPLHHLPIARSGVNPLAEARVVATFARLYGRLRPAVVHHVTMKPVLYGSLAARLVGVPAVVNAVTGLGYAYTGGSLRARTTRVAVRALWRGAFGHPRLGAIFQNTEDRDEFVAAGVVRADQVVMTRGSGVDLARFRPAESPPAVPTVLLAARLLWLKGVGEFVEAARRLRARGTAARFVIVGDTDDNPTAIPEAQLREWEAEGVVEWWGRRDDMPEVLRSATVFCLPTYYREGIPKAVLEAAATGLAIVTTDVRGVREAVTHEVDGLLVPPRDPEALAEALARVLGDDGLRTRLGAAARDRAEREFGVAAVVETTLATYRALAGR